jgi:hypothetical protein
MNNNSTTLSLTKLLAIAVCFSPVGAILAQTFNWGPAGPVYTAGRARNMIVDQNDPKKETFYAGSASSGIFVTTNAGKLWKPLNDQGTVRNISYLAQAANKTIYAATGEGFLRADQKLRAQKGTGLYKLDTKNLIKVTDSSITGSVINRIACHPSNSAIIALATNKGIMISTDAGSSFSPVSLATMPTTVNVTMGMDVKFDANGILYCSIGNEQGATAALAKIRSKVFKSTNNSLSAFNEITPYSSLLADSAYGRIELAIAPSNNNVIYASCANKFKVAENSSSLNGLFVSYNAGLTWGLVLQGSPQLDPLTNGGTIASGDYAHVVTVDPTNSDRIFVGGYTLFVFERKGGPNSAPTGDWLGVGSPFFINSSFYLHENIHDVKIIPGTSSEQPKFYFVTDAGIFRSVDLANYNPPFVFPSIQRFYKGFVTGQFNSVSIEKYPTGVIPSAGGSSVTPYAGFIGGTARNGLNYFSGTDSTVTRELNYLSSTQVYNAEYSKILSDAAFFTTGSGALYRTSNVKTTAPIQLQMNVYTGALSRLAPSPVTFGNSGVTSSGTLFKLWENYGQTSALPDSVVFYNDTLRFQASMSGIPELTTKTTFTFSAIRPDKNALIDSIVVRTGTVQLPTNNFQNAPPFTGDAKQDITIKLSNNYTVSSGVTVPPISSVTGKYNAAIPPTVTLNASTKLDEISVTFSTSPFVTFTTPYYPSNASPTSAVVPDAAAYYKVFATVFYKYKTGDTLSIVNSNISTKTNSYTVVLSKPLNWAYGSNAPTYLLAADVKTAIPSPTYVLNPGNVTQSTPVFTVNSAGLMNYTITQLGTYTLNAKPINSYTLVAETNTAIPSPTYVLNPGNLSQSDPTFVVTPSVLTNYTITQNGAGTLTAETYSTIDTPTYVLNPGNVSQNSPEFIVTPTINTTYTVLGLSSNTVAAANTSTTYVTQAFNTFSTTGSSVVFVQNNKPVKSGILQNARLAVYMNHSSITGGKDAIVVARSPLDLNDPLSFVRVSQTGAYKDDASGNPTTTSITILGKPVAMEWSKSGTELYYATAETNGTNHIYRVSHIHSIMDLTPANYSGKFFNDIFQYSAPVSEKPNPVSPFRTTLLGSFDKQITSLAVSNDNKNVLVTFNNPAQTGTTGIVMINSNDAKISDISNINWVNKDSPALKDNVTYCSLMEKGDNNKVLIGTDNGIYYTTNIAAAAPTWVNVNNNQLPNVQISDIKQQVLLPWDCYNSGQIYVATFGRGVWMTRAFFEPNYVAIEEHEKRTRENNLSLYPNPTNGNVTLVFNGINGETASVNILDISGRLVKSEQIGKLDSGEIKYSFGTEQLNAGVYLVSVQSSSGIKRISKLIVTK